MSDLQCHVRPALYAWRHWSLALDRIAALADCRHRHVTPRATSRKARSQGSIMPPPPPEPPPPVPLSTGPVHRRRW